MRINLSDEQMEYIGTMADKLDISISELCKRALHMVDTVQLCEAQGIKAVFIEEDENISFKDLFDDLWLSDNTPAEGATTDPVGIVENEADTIRDCASF